MFVALIIQVVMDVAEGENEGTGADGQKDERPFMGAKERLLDSEAVLPLGFRRRRIEEEQ